MMAVLQLLHHHRVVHFYVVKCALSDVGTKPDPRLISDKLQRSFAREYAGENAWTANTYSP
jgi:hypothetical protein